MRNSKRFIAFIIEIVIGVALLTCSALGWLTSRWNVNYSSGYDFTQKKMSMTTVNITRDLHCFTMSCGLVFGPFTSYNFSIRALSSMLTVVMDIFFCVKS